MVSIRASSGMEWESRRPTSSSIEVARPIRSMVWRCWTVWSTQAKEKMTKNQGPTIPSAVPQRPGIRSIPTRIRDLRQQPVPPLVIEPVAGQQQVAVREALGELGSKVAEIHRTVAEAY